MKIPIFVSTPTVLNKKQQEIQNKIFTILDLYNLEPRTLGQSDYPTQLPLREVLAIAKHCAGALILGFEQYFARDVIIKKKTSQEKRQKKLSYPTPWNHLEAGILYALQIPMLVFKEKNISGGIFDNGVSDVFIHPMPTKKNFNESQLHDIFLKWQSEVRKFYYG